jgi:hypothetical protein
MTEVTCDIDLYESEMLQIAKMNQKLRRAIATHRDLESFRREIIERFDEIGLIAHVALYEDTSGPEPIYWPAITITGRHEARVFDHDRMRHEVQSNLRGLPGQDNVAPLRISVPRTLPS